MAIDDIIVSHISRRPLYERYRVQYTPDPFITEEEERRKRIPEPGDAVEFEAKIVNRGKSVEVPYTWYIDDRIVDRGKITIANNSISEQKTKWVWQPGRHSVRFEMGPKSMSKYMEDFTDALYYSMHIEPDVYKIFNSLENMVGTHSFEDWIQHHIKTMNQWFEHAGCNERVRIDEIVIEKNLPDVGEHAPEDILWDGRWGFCRKEWSDGKIRKEVSSVQGTLIHELIHQLGMIDMYNLDIDVPEKNIVTGETRLFGAENSQRDIMADTNAHFISEYTAMALNSELGRRRGFFGRFLLDIPKQNYLRIIDSSKRPVEGVSLKVYQTENRVLSPDRVKFSGCTDSSGIFSLGEHPFSSNASLNPNVVGLNGVFYIVLEKNNRIRTGWLDITEFNMAYWRGNRDSALYELEF